MSQPNRGPEDTHLSQSLVDNAQAAGLDAVRAQAATQGIERAQRGAASELPTGETVHEAEPLKAHGDALLSRAIRRANDAEGSVER